MYNTIKKIKIKSSNVEVTAELNGTKTASAIWDNLPIEGKANTWGEEIYFSVPVKVSPENPRVVVELGDLGYWPPGSAFCIFFGETPISSKGEIKPASPVNVFGKFDTKKIDDLRKIKDGEKITISKEK